MVEGMLSNASYCNASMQPTTQGIRMLLRAEHRKPPPEEEAGSGKKSRIHHLVCEVSTHFLLLTHPMGLSSCMSTSDSTPCWKKLLVSNNTRRSWLQPRRPRRCRHHRPLAASPC